MDESAAPPTPPAGEVPKGAPGRPPGRPKNAKAKWFRHLSASSLGIEIGLTIALGWFGGRWLELNVTHWSPWTRYLGFLVGCGAGVLAIRRTIREYREYLAELEAEKAQVGRPGEGKGADAAEGL